MTPEGSAGASPHAPYEDALAIAMGTLFVAIGVAFYGQAGLVTGGTAGLALLVSHGSGWGFGPVFWAINLPFYALAGLRLGWKVALRTLLAVSLVSVFARYVPDWMSLARLDPLFAALAGGGLMGTGLLILFRHRTGLGGVNLLAIFLQERFGWRAGWFQLGLDLAILAAAFFFLTPGAILLSVAGAVVTNTTLAINHRPGRYLGMT